MDEEVMNEATDTQMPAKHKLYSHFPDKEYPEGDHTAVMDDAYEEITSGRSYKSENEATNAELIKALEDDEDLMAIVVGVIRDKVPARVTAARIWGPDGLTAEEGDPDFEEVTKAHQEHLKMKGENETFLAEVKANIQKSQEDIDAFTEEKGMSEEEKVDFLKSVTATFENAYKGIVSREYLATQYVADNHQKEVDKEVENAVIDTKNGMIEEKLATESSAKEGDGLPAITAGMAKVETPKVKKTNPAANFLKGTGIGGA